MSLEASGLALLKLKWPGLRGQLESAFKQSDDFRQLVAGYAEAVMYREAIVRGTKPRTNLKEYDVLCNDIEVDIRRAVLFYAQYRRANPIAPSH
ncbi:hypothetical protein [Rhizobium tubonense]|uniref:Uncharacterized protein n=1 Tax=Rhizobium tubonense TaxID=484088 RepID=A0A2W4D0A1_9HYPH|nr:hypothetical protein [Rhizobium tubonense]PZM16398.1 hypothetical protein CPY51_03360 [Rhizobium tubonense]